MTLQCAGITRTFGGVHALEDVDLTVGSGEIVGLIGPNGSGKSTLVNTVSGFLPPDRGTIELDGQSLLGLGAAATRRAGVARTFQNLRLIEPLSVLENVLMGLHLTYTGGRGIYWQWLPAMLSLPSARKADRRARELAHSALGKLGLEDKAHVEVANLSYGDRKRVELARIIALSPRVLLLDEPTAGLNPDEADELMRTIVALVSEESDSGHVLLIEHRLELVLGLCDRVAVLDSGRKIADGRPEEVAKDPEVIRVYIGDQGMSHEKVTDDAALG